ncbi:APC family permease [Parasphingorhabdus sp.]|uniref:APC family permease n=1 Tax=Parasphingorhabdus sp. TaxID=2709688 RepID=UPI003001AB47
MIVQPASAGHLQKRLGLAFGLAVGIGSVIGSGIMRAPGVITNEVPDPWIAMLLWLVGGVFILLSANITAELSTALPKAGGFYVPVREAFGDSMGLLAGWATFAGYTAGTAAVALACADFLGMVFPWAASHAQMLAALIALVVTALNWIGVQEGRLIQIIGTVVKLGLLSVVIIIAFTVDPATADSAATASAVVGGAVTMVGIITALQLIVGAYDGWYSAMFFAEEDTDPGRNIPRAMFRSCVIVIAVYLTLNLSMYMALDIATLRQSDLPVALVVERGFGSIGMTLVALLAAFMTVVTLNSLIMIMPRVLFGMARDGLFLHSATRVNRGGTPDIALLVSAVLTVGLIFSGGFIFVFKLMGALSIFVSVLYAVAFFALRRRQPDLPRPFRAIGYPLLPIIALLVSIALLGSFIFADPISGLYMLGLIAICIPVGIVLHRRRIAHRTAVGFVIAK